MTNPKLSGQKVLNSSPVQLPDVDGIIITLKSHPDNTDTVWVGALSGTLATNTGFPLNPGEAVMVAVEGNLEQLRALSDVDGEKICWIVTDR